MKLRLWIILCMACLLFHSTGGAADPNAELIERFPSGEINWTRGVVTAQGSVDLQNTSVGELNGQALERARKIAVDNLLETLLQLRVNHQRCAADLFEVNDTTQRKVGEMAAASKIMDEYQDIAGKQEVTVQMSLYGGFAQLVLPAEIRQVQPIKPLNGLSEGREPQKRGIYPPIEGLEADTYTGLIVDARGTGAKPSLVPLLVDETGEEVFGPAYVSREFAVQYGLCQYIRMSEDLDALPRVAPKPLLVKGLRTDRPGSCRIVISNADASKLRRKSSHLEFLKRCRVVIVLD